MTNDNQRAKDLRKFQAMLRKAGWRNRHGGCYVSRFGKEFHTLNCDDGENENWVQWYERGETPPPF